MHFAGCAVMQSQVKLCFLTLFFRDRNTGPTGVAARCTATGETNRRLGPKISHCPSLRSLPLKTETFRRQSGRLDPSTFLFAYIAFLAI